MPRVEVTGASCFVWKGDVVCPGVVLECTVAEAHVIVDGWKQGRYVNGVPAPTRPGMVVNADPVADHRDPEIVKAQKEIDRDPNERVTEMVMRKRGRK